MLLLMCCKKHQPSTLFWWIVQTQTEWLPDVETVTHHLGRSWQNFDSQILWWGNFSFILLDFADNYKYIVQDEVQGFHWNKDQCTLHPVVIYYKNEENELVHKSLCILSDDLDYDTSFVHQLQRLVCDFIKATLPQITRIEYWSDGCAGQYKKPHELMLSQERLRYRCNMVVGKSPCDGIGGTVKRKIARTSLQRPVSNQILTFKAVKQFCTENLATISFFSIYKEDMVQVREILERRYSLGDTIPGTRSCHHFEPVSTTSIDGKQLSDDTVCSIKNHLTR